MEEALFVFAVRNMDFLEFEGFRDGEVNFEGGEEGFCGLVVELEAFHEFDIAEVRGVGGELAEGFGRAGLAGAGERGGDGLDFVADDDDSVDGDV
ncbi:MAG: hypothetical protein RLZZ245_207 [Verrucomicrobiota bacterium]